MQNGLWWPASWAGDFLMGGRERYFCFLCIFCDSFVSESSILIPHFITSKYIFISKPAGESLVCAGGRRGPCEQRLGDAPLSPKYFASPNSPYFNIRISSLPFSPITCPTPNHVCSSPTSAPRERTTLNEHTFVRHLRCTSHSGIRKYK